MVYAVIKLIFQVRKVFENIARFTWVHRDMDALMLMELQALEDNVAIHIIRRPTSELYPKDIFMNLCRDCLGRTFITGLFVTQRD